MTKKDLIIIAVLANMGVLAVIFMLASRVEDDPISHPEEVSYIIQDMIQKPVSGASDQNKTESPGMDLLLGKNNPQEPSNEFVLEEEIPLLDQEPAAAAATDTTDENGDELAGNGSFVEVTVKRGDALEKIARSHGTTVQAIKKANGLTSDRLKIGQVLRIPEGQIATPVNSSEASAPKYYTMKNGDSPWKIAKKLNMDVNDLLKLNDLDEDKARNLKVGDQIRVK